MARQAQTSGKNRRRVKREARASARREGRGAATDPIQHGSAAAHDHINVWLTPEPLFDRDQEHGRNSQRPLILVRLNADSQ